MSKGFLTRKTQEDWYLYEVFAIPCSYLFDEAGARRRARSDRHHLTRRRPGLNGYFLALKAAITWVTLFRPASTRRGAGPRHNNRPFPFLDQRVMWLCSGLRRIEPNTSFARSANEPLLWVASVPDAIRTLISGLPQAAQAVPVRLKMRIIRQKRLAVFPQAAMTTSPPFKYRFLSKSLLYGRELSTWQMNIDVLQ